jgi:hypothetical protein
MLSGINGPFMCDFFATRPFLHQNEEQQAMRTLSPQEIEQVAGAIYHEPEPAPPEPAPGPGQEPPFPPELHPVPQ